jgi:hypothetical protein
MILSAVAHLEDADRRERIAAEPKARTAEQREAERIRSRRAAARPERELGGPEATSEGPPVARHSIT